MLEISEMIYELCKTYLIAVAFYLLSTVFVIRSFYGMRIRSGAQAPLKR